MSTFVSLGLVKVEHLRRWGWRVGVGPCWCCPWYGAGGRGWYTGAGPFSYRRGAAVRRLLAAGALVLLAGCEGSAAPAVGQSPPASQASPAAPVTSITPSYASAPDPDAIIREIPGAKALVPTPGGPSDVMGDRLGEGNIYGPGCTAADNCGEAITVYTNTSQAQLNANMAQLFSNPSGQAIITGPRFVMTVTGVAGNNGGTEYFTSPAKIAADVHGHLAYNPPGG